jgi:Ser/Thr protein kinase RdoA (MazF antagonist)
VSHEELWKKELDLFDRIADQTIRSYPNLSGATIRLLNYSENATYLLEEEKTSQKYILRVSRPGYHTKAEIESELDWLEAINKETPIEVHQPIPNNKGRYIQVVHLDDEQDYYSTIFSFLKGDSPEEGTVLDLIRHFETLGEITAHLHEHSNQWIQRKQVTRNYWDYETILGDRPKWGKWQDGLAMTPERVSLFQEVSEVIKERLEKFGKDPDRFGIIHADLRLANFIIEGDQIKVIDFDDCGFGWYLFDFASSISFIEHEPYVPDLKKAWLKGYRKVRALSEEEEREIPTFIMMRRLMLISWIGSRDNETSRQMGSQYTIQTDRLAQTYLENYRGN